MLSSGALRLVCLLVELARSFIRGRRGRRRGRGGPRRVCGLHRNARHSNNRTTSISHSMFGARVILRLRRPTQPFVINVRLQSSSSSSATKLLQAKTQKLQQQLHKTIQQQQSQQAGVQPGPSAGGSGGQKTGKGKDGVPRTVSSQQRAAPKLRKGFSNVDKVPSTVNLEPRDVLLDKLYQGYNPLLSPIKPKAKKTSPKILVNIYEDLAFEDDGYENDDAVDSLVGPKLQISKYIFDKNPQMEAKLKELDVDAKEAKEASQDRHDPLFERRPAADGKRGRVRLHYKKNMTKNGGGGVGGDDDGHSDNSN